MRTFWKRVLVGAALAVVGLVLLPAVVALAPFRRWRGDKQLLWGPTPILNNKYWSLAMRQGGVASVTVMDGWFQSINQRSDFDLYHDDLLPRFVPLTIRRITGPYVAFGHHLAHASVAHVPYSGGPLGRTPYWRLEAPLYRLFGIRVVALAFGADIFRYSTIQDRSLRHALLRSYPDAARRERAIGRRVNYWERWADATVPAIAMDGMARWDVLTPQAVCIDTDEWRRRPPSGADGRSEVVRILHAPNHRGFKGTEFIRAAVEQLAAEGLAVELVLVEGRPNDEVRAIMQDVHILVEQLIFCGYALTALEGMASGLAVMANLDDDAQLRVFRRFSFLDECPVVSTTPERVVDDLRRLVTDAGLRNQLGRASREYVEKHHSLEAARLLFGAIHDHVLGRRQVDLLDLYHPMRAEGPRVDHPLVNNRLVGERL